MFHFWYLLVKRPFGKGIFSWVFGGGPKVFLFWYTPEVVDELGG